MAPASAIRLSAAKAEMAAKNASLTPRRRLANASLYWLLGERAPTCVTVWRHHGRHRHHRRPERTTASPLWQARWQASSQYSPARRASERVWETWGTWERAAAATLLDARYSTHATRRWRARNTAGRWRRSGLRHRLPEQSRATPVLRWRSAARATAGQPPQQRV